MQRRVLFLVGVVPAIAIAWNVSRSSFRSTTLDASALASCKAALAPGPSVTDVDREIARVQHEAGEGADTGPALERLGYLLVSRARSRNDSGDYALAEAAAACLESRYPGRAAALLLRGHVLHQLHRFKDAEVVARTLVARRNYVLDYGLLGDVLMEQGRLGEAAVAYQKMLDLKPFYQSYTRAAHLRWLKGDLDGAIESLQLAIAAASPRDPESSAWAWTRLASYELQASRLTEAANAVDAALGFQPDYAAALLARGRILLARNRDSEAVAVLRRATELNPLPEYQWMLADALRERGSIDEASAVEQELTGRGAAADPRSVALFLATRRTDPAKALQLAQAELQIRSDIFTLDAYAWALAANGRAGEAKAVMDRALAEGTADARLFLHAGVIHAAGGRTAEARRWLKKAEAVKAMLLPSEAAELAKHLNQPIN